MVEGGLPADRMHVIPNFVANDQFREEPDREATDPPMVLFVGRLEEVKGIRVLLEAARTVAPEVEVIVVGHGLLEAEVEKAACEGTVHYLGRRDWREIAQLMDRARAVVVPSLWEENCPMVVLEAGARGCPLIASDRGGLTELVTDGEDGLLFPAGDVEALVESIRSLVSDTELWRKVMSARRLRTNAYYSAAAHYPQLLQTYEMILDSHT
jgi:glycosyltransferase involved in cell wall biosynthesis